jgi:autotransporter-associated beta strand protein
MDGTGTFTMGTGGSSAYTGTTTINSGTLTLGNKDRINDSSSLVVNGGVFSMTTRNETVAGVTLTGGSITSTTGILTSTGNYNLQNGSISASLAGSGALNKTTAGNVTLSGNNTGFTGATTINSGTLTAAAAGSLGSTSNIDVNGGSFLVTASNSVSDTATINLNGGTLAIEGGVGEVVGALTLSANSTLDMNGVGNTWITFASLTSVLDNLHRLEVWNYTPGSDAIYFQDQTNLASSLNYISFYSGAGTGTFYNALNTSSFSAPELYATVVPEPSTYIAAVLLLCGLGVQFFRRRQNLGKRG